MSLLRRTLPRFFATGSNTSFLVNDISRIRNIGISAHVDSGKTTTSERILFYTGQIKEVNEIASKVGSKMDHMELERERGITIQSAASYCRWSAIDYNNQRHNVDSPQDFHINLIDTPGHVDFTMEVERALAVLDGAILIICGVNGVQAQTYTVNKQIDRYKIPRIAFINKLDRRGSDAFSVLSQIRNKLGIHSALIQYPIMIKKTSEYSVIGGIVDLVLNKAFVYEGQNGILRNELTEIPKDIAEDVIKYRTELFEHIADVDDEFAEILIDSEDINEINTTSIYQAIRRASISREFVPIFVGSAKGNVGVHDLLDGVCHYLPSPKDTSYVGLDVYDETVKVPLQVNDKAPLVAMAFKIQELEPHGLLTYLRIYQGHLEKNMTLYLENGNRVNSTGKSDVPSFKIPKIVRMHSSDAKEVNRASAGDIVAVKGLDVPSGYTVTDGKKPLTMSTMHVPATVMDASLTIEGYEETIALKKALNRFAKEDPTFQVAFDDETKKYIISCMGELHLEIYVERMKREYGIDVIKSPPTVKYRECIGNGIRDFRYRHKRQSGGRGEFAEIMGSIRPVDHVEVFKMDKSELLDNGCYFSFNADAVPGTISKQFVRAVKRGFTEWLEEGGYIGKPVLNVEVELNDLGVHDVDSSDKAFKNCVKKFLNECYMDLDPYILEPIMTVEITCPFDSRDAVGETLMERQGVVTNTTPNLEMTIATVIGEVPLRCMFGYCMDLRRVTSGTGEFSMEFLEYRRAPDDISAELNNAYVQAEKEKKMIFD